MLKYAALSDKCLDNGEEEKEMKVEGGKTRRGIAGREGKSEVEKEEKEEERIYRGLERITKEEQTRTAMLGPTR